MSASFPDYPASFPSHSRPQSRAYRMRDDCFAGPSDAAALRGRPVQGTLPEEGLSIFSGQPPARAPAASDCRPVYALSEREPPAIPTGRVFVQAGRGVKLADAVGPLGYQVESVPGYAPHAAWVVARDGTIATALSNLASLMALENLDSVEPQMLRPAHRRQTGSAAT